MSKTLFVEFQDEGFWVYDVVSSVFLKFLIDELSRIEEPWVQKIIEHWKVNVIISDFGLYLDNEWSETQVKTVVECCEKANATIHDCKSFSGKEVKSWIILDNTSIDPRSHEMIPSVPIIQFGKGLILLMQNQLPQPPENHWWFYSMESELKTIKMKNTDS